MCLRSRADFRGCSLSSSLPKAGCEGGSFSRIYGGLNVRKMPIFCRVLEFMKTGVSNR